MRIIYEVRLGNRIRTNTIWLRFWLHYLASKMPQISDERGASIASSGEYIPIDNAPNIAHAVRYSIEKDLLNERMHYCIGYQISVRKISAMFIDSFSNSGTARHA